MIDQIQVAGLRAGRCVVVPGVAYLSGSADAVAEGLEQAERQLGTLQVLVRQRVDDEYSVQIRYPAPLGFDKGGTISLV